MEGLRLRVKDIDFSRHEWHEVLVRGGKRNKDGDRDPSRWTRNAKAPALDSGDAADAKR